VTKAEEETRLFKRTSLEVIVGAAQECEESREGRLSQEIDQRRKTWESFRSSRTRMAESAPCSPTLPPEIVEKILIEVLKQEDPDVDIFRLENPFLTFFRCRGVNRLWRDCANNIIRKLGKSPEVRLSDQHKEYLLRDEYFVQFATKLLKDDFWDDVNATFKDHRLIPHYRDFLVRTLALRSPNVADSRTIRLDAHYSVNGAAISTEYAIVSAARVSYGQTDWQILIYDCNDTNDVPRPLQPFVPFRLHLPKVCKMEIISDIYGEEHLFLRTISWFAAINNLSHKDFALSKVKLSHMLLLDAQIRYRTYSTCLICISDTGFFQFCVAPQPTLRSVRTRWPSYEAVEGTHARPSDGEWIFCHGTFQIFIELPSKVTIKVLKKGRGGSRDTHGSQKSFNPLALFQGGHITECCLESNVLFLGTSNGFMHSYILGKGGISGLDLEAPDFTYRHELGEPVRSISIARCNRNTGMVRILVCYRDRLHVITKSPSADFSQ